jgi:hypothetical protein
MARICGVAQFGYAVDGHHQWTICAKYDHYMRPTNIWMPAATVLLDDVMDVVAPLIYMGLGGYVCC